MSTKWAYTTRNQDFSIFKKLFVGNYLGHKWSLGSCHVLVFTFAIKIPILGFGISYIEFLVISSKKGTH